MHQCNHTPNRSDPEQIDQIRTADDQRLRSNVANWEVTNENELFEQPSTEHHNTSVAEKKIKISSHLSEDPATSKNDLWFQQNSINVEESESVKSKAISIGKKIFNENSEDENEIDRDDHHGEQEENDRRDCGGDTAKDIKTIVKTNKSNGYLIKPTQLVQTINRKLTSLTNGSSLNKRNKPRPEPLYIPPHVNTFVFHSRLRSPRLWTSMNKTSNNKSSISPPPYTPPPMLSPVRSGSGLFWKIDSKCSLNSQSSSFLNKKFHSSESEENNETDPIKTPKTAYEPYEINIPTTDIQPHVNIGPNYQARIPEFNRNRSKIYSKSEKAVLCWNPNVLKKIDPETLDLYLKISYREVWTDEEIILFRKSILKYDKDFFLISKQNF
ncbi:rest corepressor (corest)-like protein [Sarcoptes scabiei]|uniref:Rest corepressor (Corest)-like protein n=1 Tax=Sarcoptes scabiei TaxID=52283 RepID=A0A131ZUP6_SARSC|nr:rest corepressor (corest)-like protein [Sarcoptes scabiei]